MKITDQIKDLYSAMLLLEQLDDSEYLESNWISPEESEEFKTYTKEQIQNYKDQAKDYINYKLRQRQELLLPIPGIKAEIERLKTLEENYQKKSDAIEKWVDYLMQGFGLTELQTELNKLSYRKSEAVILTDEASIPEEYKNKKITISVDKAELKKALKSGIKISGAVIETRQNLQIK